MDFFRSHQYRKNGAARESLVVSNAGSRLSKLSHSLGIEMPIAEELDRVLHGGKSVRECVQRLLGRALTEE